MRILDMLGYATLATLLSFSSARADEHDIATDVSNRAREVAAQAMSAIDDAPLDDMYKDAEFLSMRAAAQAIMIIGDAPLSKDAPIEQVVSDIIDNAPVDFSVPRPRGAPDLTRQPVHGMASSLLSYIHGKGIAQLPSTSQEKMWVKQEAAIFFESEDYATVIDIFKALNEPIPSDKLIHEFTSPRRSTFYYPSKHSTKKGRGALSSYEKDFLKKHKDDFSPLKQVGLAVRLINSKRRLNFDSKKIAFGILQEHVHLLTADDIGYVIEGMLSTYNPHKSAYFTLDDALSFYRKCGLPTDRRSIGIVEKAHTLGKFDLSILLAHLNPEKEDLKKMGESLMDSAIDCDAAEIIAQELGIRYSSQSYLSAAQHFFSLQDRFAKEQVEDYLIRKRQSFAKATKYLVFARGRGSAELFEEEVKTKWDDLSVSIADIVHGYKHEHESLATRNVLERFERRVEKNKSLYEKFTFGRQTTVSLNGLNYDTSEFCEIAAGQALFDNFEAAETYLAFDDNGDFGYELHDHLVATFKKRPGLVGLFVEAYKRCGQKRFDDYKESVELMAGFLVEDKAYHQARILYAATQNKEKVSMVDTMLKEQNP